MYRTCQECGFRVNEHTTDWTDGYCSECGAVLTSRAQNSVAENVVITMIVVAIVVFIFGVFGGHSPSPDRYEEDIPYEVYMDSYVTP